MSKENNNLNITDVENYLHTIFDYDDKIAFLQQEVNAIRAEEALLLSMVKAFDMLEKEHVR